MASNKKKHKPASSSIIENDRKNCLTNAEDYIYSILFIYRRYHSQNSSLSSQDFINLRRYITKCLNLLNKYLYPREPKGVDQMLREVENQLRRTEREAQLSEGERKWLRKFNGIESLIPELTDVSSIHSVEEIFNALNTHRSQANQIRTEQLAECSAELCLRDALKMAIGVGLVCEDGLKFYKSQSNFSVESIRRGAGLLLDSTNNLLTRVNSSN